MGNIYPSLVEEFALYRDRFYQELTGNILPWWVKYAVKPDGSGFYGAADRRGNPVEANLSCVLTARILWTYSAAARMLDDPTWQPMADLAYKVLQEQFLDTVYGGYFMEVKPDGTPANDIKHTYAQAFVIYALAKYYELNGRADVLGRMTGFFDQLERVAKDSAHPGYIEAFTRDWEPFGVNRMADNNEPRSMNTHLHVLEAWSALFKVWPDQLVGKRLRELLELFLTKIIRPTGHLGIFFDLDFNEAASSKGTCSFGHDIEASWLLIEAADTLGDAGIRERMKKVCIRMADAVAREGVDQDGGLFLESTRYGSHLRTNKHWWPQAENLVGFLNAFELTGETKYWEIVKKAWHFIDHHVIDHEYGEWFTKVNRLGVPFLEEPPDDPSPYYRNDWKIDPWKCPYHNGRAMMELVEIVSRQVLC
ncbi:MAG: AGE family epimerase/isomerase [Bacteroidales bacterium]